MQKNIYHILFEPRSRLDDSRRRELILNVLLVGILALILLAFIAAAIKVSADGSSRLSLPILAGIGAFFATLLWLSRKGHFAVAATAFTIAYFLIALYANMRWGVLLPQGVLACALVIVMAGILINSRAAFVAAASVTIGLLLVKLFENQGLIHVNTKWMEQTGDYGDVMVYGFTFAVIALVSWLSNREIDRSMKRARHTEELLRAERNSLKEKVVKRTRELENIQVEKMLELQRFAEFGRMSSALLHDIANPLTAVSLTLSEMSGTKEQQKLLEMARKNLVFMERYIQTARRQLQNESEKRPFRPGDEIKQIAELLRSKAQKEGVSIEIDVQPSIELVGDSTHFHHIVTNLVTNAIDAYRDSSLKKKRVEISCHRVDGTLEIIIRDHGAGISPQVREHLFEPFYTTKKSKRGNVGIGLTIVKDTLEESFGGMIEVESTPNKGTSFIVRIPMDQA